MKIVGICGEPAAGKSTVMRKLISSLSGPGELKKEKLVVYTEYHEDKVFVAGIYDEQVFSGTDRTSKGCGPTYRQWIADKNSNPAYDDWTFYWEGERFSNSKFFDFFTKECSDSTIYFLKADPEVLNERNKARSNQNDSWRRGMTTRMNNLRTNYSVVEVEQDWELPSKN